ncbi:MAG: ABC transporter permease subunit [Propionibacteriales bacterium]|nr:ABC transporter permease subunit [Propionibacteriales bacterium]
MRAYIVRRLMQAVLVVFVVITLMFFLFRLMPADPTTMLVESGLPEQARQDLLERWGLTGSLADQYWSYLTNLATGDFGTSFFYQEPAWNVLAPLILNTLWIAVPGMLLGALIGCGLGVVVGWARRGGPVERAGIFLATFVRGVPSFVLGIFILMVFSTWLGWFPGFGIGELGDGFTRYFTWSFLAHLILPVMTLAIFFLPENLLLMRTGVVENRGEDYLELVRAKGVKESRVAWHAARNSLLPVITWLFPALAETVAGIVIIEVVFSWPGIGRELVLAVNRQDYPIAQTAFFLLAVMIVLANLAADLVYAKLDPRVSYE